MKTLESLKKSHKASHERLKQMLESLTRLTENEPTAAGYRILRDRANMITQCVHEMSAYHNAMHTE
jgi:hypothetical protein